MSYLDKILQPGEQIVARGKKHWIIYAPGAAVLVFAIVLAGLIPAFPGIAVALQIAAVIAAVVAVVVVFREWFDQWTTEIVVTNRRVVYKRGFISRFTREMNMEKIESVAVDQTLPGRLFGYGTIDIRGTGAGLEQLTGIAGPIELRNAITVH
ncbi:MAG: PH domain-containing protein [Devosia sp.]|nr:PH domain-containing protein [Devosia sp.]